MDWMDVDLLESVIAAKAWIVIAAVYCLPSCRCSLVRASSGSSSARRRSGRPRVGPRGPWSGRLAFLRHRFPWRLHGVFILGLEDDEPACRRVLDLGSFVYGVFVVNMFFVHDGLHPRWALPVVEG